VTSFRWSLLTYTLGGYGVMVEVERFLSLTNLARGKLYPREPLISIISNIMPSSWSATIIPQNNVVFLAVLLFIIIQKVLWMKMFD
jgi:hypothetical protein